MEKRIRGWENEDENIKIKIDTVEKYDSTIYIADIQLKDASYLKTIQRGKDIHD